MKTADMIRWSFGGNRLQVKAEVQLLADVALAFQQVGAVGSKLPSLRPLTGKQDLLQALLSSEQTRLLVWLYPVDNGNRGRGLSDVSRVLLVIPSQANFTSGTCLRPSANGVGREPSYCHSFRIKVFFSACD